MQNSCLARKWNLGLNLLVKSARKRGLCGEFATICACSREGHTGRSPSYPKPYNKLNTFRLFEALHLLRGFI